jgi:hypothetical protein
MSISSASAFGGSDLLPENWPTIRCKVLTVVSHTDDSALRFVWRMNEKCYKVGTQFGTQKCAKRAVEAVDAAHAVRNVLRKFSAC